MLKLGCPKKWGKIRIMVRRIKELEDELKRTRIAFKESEDRYRSLIKQSSDGVYIFDPETAKIIEANDQFLKILGYNEEEIKTKKIYEIINLDKKVIDSNIKKVLEHGQHLLELRRYLRKDGSIVDLEISSTLIQYNDGHVVMVNVRDVTERIRAENELKKQAEKLKDQAELLDIAEDAIIVTDMEGKIVYWNNGAQERYGWKKEDVIGRDIHQLLKTEFSLPLKELIVRVLNEGKWEGELCHTRHDGTKIIVESKWVLRRDRDGKPAAIMEINNDITKYKYAERELQKAKEELERRVEERTAELKEANERLLLELNRRKRIEDMLRKAAVQYKNLFENSPIGIYRTNPEGRILMANPTLLRMLGYNSFNELASKKIKNRDYEPTYLRKKIKKRLEKEERVRGFEAKWIRPDKSVIFVRENAKAIKAADGTVLYYEGTVEDISEQKKAEEKIRSYQRQLRSLASDLSLAEERERRRIATMLHDHIGQTLAISKIKLGALLGRSDDADIINSLKELREHIDLAIQYVRSLTFELSPPILYELGLEAALEWLAEQVHEQHHIQYEFENDLQPKPISEEVRIFLFTAVRELLINVVKHAKASKVKITVRRIGENVAIHVADDGIGFNASRMTYYLDENKGFGLFSIRERLTHLGGQVEIRSQRGRGTRIVLLAPLKMD